MRSPDNIGFTKAVLQVLWDGFDLDGGDIQDLGLMYGVIRETKFDPAVHTDHLGVGAEAGDQWFVENLPGSQP